MSDAAELSPPPLKMPKFVLLVGGIHTVELQEQLCAIDPTRCGVNLHFLGLEIARAYTSNEELERKDLLVPGVFVEDFDHTLEMMMKNQLGLDYAAVGFINNYDAGQHGDDVDYIFPDATPDDVRPFVERFSDENVLVIYTGKLAESGIAKQNVWLPMPSLAERMALLRRELGEVV